VRGIDVVASFGGRTYVSVQDIGAPMLVVDLDDRIAEISAAAHTLLAKFDLPCIGGAKLPQPLIAQLENTMYGVAIMWRPLGEGPILGFTRYKLGAQHHLVLMREITQQQRVISQRLHQQRLQETGKLVAHIAHDLRAPLASIVYNADVLRQRDLGASNDLIVEIQHASENLRRTIAGLLDFVRLGPPVHAVVGLRDVCDRVSSLLRPMFRAGHHELSIKLHDEDVRIGGNPIGIEQIFVNLLVNAMEATARPAKIQISSEPAPAQPPRQWRAKHVVLVRVQDDGPGVPAERREAVFEAYETSKPSGTGLGLTITREAVINLGGNVWIEDTSEGCSFAIALPVVGEGA
jgi:signal transduction histidine kinase